MEELHVQVISNGERQHFDKNAKAEIRALYRKFFAKHPSGIRDFWLTIKSSINKTAFTGDLFIKTLITPGAIRLNKPREVEALCKLIEKNEALQTTLLRISLFGYTKAENMLLVNMKSQALATTAMEWRNEKRDNEVMEFFKANPDLMLEMFSKCPTFVAKVTHDSLVPELVKQFPGIIPIIYEREVVKKLLEIGRKNLPLQPYAETPLKKMLYYLFPQYIDNPNEKAAQEIRSRYVADVEFFKLAIGENFEQLDVISIAGDPVDFLEQLSKTKKGQQFIKNNIYKITVYLIDHVDVNDAALRRLFKRPRRHTKSYLKALRFYLQQNAKAFLGVEQNITYTRLFEHALKILSLPFVRKSCKLSSEQLGALLNFKDGEALGKHSHDMEKLLCNDRLLFSRLLKNESFFKHIEPKADVVPTFPYVTALNDMQFRHNKKTGDNQNLYEWYVHKQQDAQRAYVLATHSKYWTKVTTLKDRFQTALYSLLIRIFDTFSWAEKSKKYKEKLDALKVKFDAHHPLLGLRMDYFKESPKQRFDKYLLGCTNKLRSLYHLTNAMADEEKQTVQRDKIKDVFRLMFYMATPQAFFELCEELKEAVHEDAGLREYCIPVLLADVNFTGKYCEYLRDQEKVSDFYKSELFASLTPHQHALNMTSKNKALSIYDLSHLKNNDEGREKLFEVLIDPDVELVTKRNVLKALDPQDKFLLDSAQQYGIEKLTSKQHFDLFLLNPARLENFVCDKEILRKILADDNLLLDVIRHPCIADNFDDEHLGKVIFAEYTDETIKPIASLFLRNPELLWRIMQLELDFHDETATKNFKRIWRGESKVLIQAGIRNIIDGGKIKLKRLVDQNSYFLNLVAGDIFYTDKDMFDAMQLVVDFGKGKTDEEKAFIDDMIAEHPGKFSKIQLQKMGKIKEGQSHRDGDAAKLMSTSFVAELASKKQDSSEESSDDADPNKTWEFGGDSH